MPAPDSLDLLPDSSWYRTAVIYQLHVRSFADGNGDGIGDFKGLTEHLDHIQELGATAVWLLPFYPSPLRDGGYDIADYTGVNPEYGTMRDFRRFVREAHRRGLRVITEVVLNHTSDQHEWFQRSRRAAPGTKWRDYYVWSDTDTAYSDARIIFKDFEASNWTWDPVAGAYFWHRFYSHQPDLNFDNPHVHAAVLKVVDFWLGLGVDGLRLDAIPYLYEREGTTCENLPETHAFLKKLRAHVDSRFSNRMLLAEANQWPEDTREYFGDGDECHMAFNFPVMPRMYMAAQMEDRYPLVDILEETPSIPDGAQWALFLRNHDELTLEMVTDEERDYMYRVYAGDPRARINLGIRRRLAPLLNNDRRKIELLNGLLLSLPGTPTIYYGDEIGMGDNIYLGDRDGVRTPMQWTADRNAGFSTANPQQLYLPVNIDPEYRYESVNVESQSRNPNSLLVWMRRIIGMRQRHDDVFGRGTLEFLRPDNAKVLCYVREGESAVLVVANLSRYTQYVELDLSDYKGHTPVEMFGQSAFPPIGDLPYLLTLGPYAFYWFALEPSALPGDDEQELLPVISSSASWTSLFDNQRSRANLESVLPKVLRGRRWFGGRSRVVTSVRIVESIPLSLGSVREYGRIMLVDVTYHDGEPETYVLPVTFLPDQHVEEFLEDHAGAGLVRVRPREGQGLSGVICDGMYEELFTSRLFETIARRQKHRAPFSEVHGLPTPQLRTLDADPADHWPSISGAEQSNTSVVFGDRFILKLFRRSEPGINPDWEVGRFLTERARFPHTPATAGALVHTAADGTSRTLAVLQEHVPNEGDAWEMTLHQLGSYYESLTGLSATEHRELAGRIPRPGTVGQDAPDLARKLFGNMLRNAELIGRRTAELHLALARADSDPDFVPEPFNPHYQRSVYQSIRNQLTLGLTALRRHRDRITGQDGELADSVLAGSDRLLDSISDLKSAKLTGSRIRIHGDYHLGQLLFTGRDFSIIDLEGESRRPISVRRFKRSPLRDVAGMMRSWQYAAHAGLGRHEERFSVSRASDLQLAQHAANFWAGWMTTGFLTAYNDLAADVLPRTRDEYRLMLRAFLMDRAASEVSHELNSRSDRVALALRGLLDLLDE